MYADILREWCLCACRLCCSISFAFNSSFFPRARSEVMPHRAGRNALALAGRWYIVMPYRAGRNALALAGRLYEVMPYRAGRNAESWA